MYILALTFGIFAALVLIYVSVVFVLAQLIEDNSIMDVAYGPAYAFAAFGTIILTNTYSLLPTLMTACITLWASRLFLRILTKNWGKPEDERYAAWRRDWLARGRVYFVLRSFTQIYLLQGSVIVLVATPFLIAVAAGDAYQTIALAVGLLVFAFGLGFETIADWQLDQFIARKRSGEADEPIMTKGLFAYSRRPNYFGEAMVWWGLALMVLPLSYGYLALISPLLITYIVTAVTGPMLERVFLEKYPEAYRGYMARTSYFIPLPPRV